MKPDFKAIRKIEKNHPFKMTAGVDDGSAFFVPVVEGKIVGDCFRLTAKKIADLAEVKPLRS